MQEGASLCARRTHPLCSPRQCSGLSAQCCSCSSLLLLLVVVVVVVGVVDVVDVVDEN
jgi:hypothetical protein